MKQLNFASISGGKDSTALYLLMQEYHGNNFLPIFADTGHEHPVTINYVKNLHVMTGGPEVVIVKADFSKALHKKGLEPTGNSFLDLMLWKGRAPSTKAQFCTEWLKLWPIKLYLQKHYPENEWQWISHTGIRGAESRKRATKQPFSFNGYFDCLQVLPMLYESSQTMFQLMEMNCVPPNPLYALGFNRVGCYPCINSNKTELSLLPEWAWARLEYYERLIGRTWFSPGILPGKPEGYIAKISEVREWCKTTRGGKNYDLLKSGEIIDAPACMSEWSYCE